MKRIRSKQPECNRLAETIEILSNPSLMRKLRRSIREAKQGKLIPWERVKQTKAALTTKLGLNVYRKKERFK